MQDDLGDELRSLREQQARANEELRARYTPTVGGPAPVSREEAETQLERIVTAGLDANDEWAPTSRTVAKMLLNTVPVFGQVVDERLATHEHRRELDADFWAMLSQDMKRPARELRKKHGRRVAQLSVDLFVDPQTRSTRPEYLNDPERALHVLKSALLKELDIVSEDISGPRGRAATGDRPGARRGPATAESQKQLDQTISMALGRR